MQDESNNNQKQIENNHKSNVNCQQILQDRPKQ